MGVSVTYKRQRAVWLGLRRSAELFGNDLINNWSQTAKVRVPDRPGVRDAPPDPVL